MKIFKQSDWVSYHLPYWERWFEPLKDRPVKFLEIGSFEGRSAVWFLDNILTHSEASIMCIDPWEWDHRDFPVDAEANCRSNLAPYGSKVTLVKGYSVDILPKIDFKIDGCYIDGSHHAKDCLTDMVFCWRLLNPGGLMLVDDYGWTNPRVPKPPKTAIDAFSTCFIIQPELSTGQAFFKKT